MKWLLIGDTKCIKIPLQREHWLRSRTWISRWKLHRCSWPIDVPVPSGPRILLPIGHGQIRLPVQPVSFHRIHSVVFHIYLANWIIFFYFITDNVFINSRNNTKKNFFYVTDNNLSIHFLINLKKKKLVKYGVGNIDFYVLSIIFSAFANGVVIIYFYLVEGSFDERSAAFLIFQATTSIFELASDLGSQVGDVFDVHLEISKA